MKIQIELYFCWEGRVTWLEGEIFQMIHKQLHNFAISTNVIGKRVSLFHWLVSGQDFSSDD